MCIKHEDSGLDKQICNFRACRFFNFLHRAREEKAKGNAWMFLIQDQYDYTEYIMCSKIPVEFDAYRDITERIKADIGDMQQIIRWIKLKWK